MTCNRDDEVIRRPDGSIDIEAYAADALGMRRAAIAAAVRACGEALARLGSALVPRQRARLTRTEGR
jgi:hypothetical protein